MQASRVALFVARMLVWEIALGLDIASVVIAGAATASVLVEPQDGFSVPLGRPATWLPALLQVFGVRPWIAPYFNDCNGALVIPLDLSPLRSMLPALLLCMLQ